MPSLPLCVKGRSYFTSFGTLALRICRDKSPRLGFCQSDWWLGSSTILVIERIYFADLYGSMGGKVTDVGFLSGTHQNTADN